MADGGPDMMTIRVTIEWPNGGEVVEAEVAADATMKEVEDAAADAFFNMCNYGWCRKGSDD